MPAASRCDGRRVASPTSMVPPERRRVGLVFQDLALFPHLSVRDNVAYGIRRDPDHAVRTDELLEMVGLAGDGRRMPHELSGGMQQRVALARALAPRPDVLLLDEPFSSLDQAMRTQLRAEVRQILREARQSAIFVTHDQGEALTVADKVAVMTRGRVLQVAPPELIYAEPATPYVATFVGVANLVPADVKDGHGRHPVRPGAPHRQRADDRPTDTRCACCAPSTSASRKRPTARPRPTAGRSSTGASRAPRSCSSCAAVDGERLWVEAGSRVRHLGLGDRVSVTLRDVETVAFGRRASIDTTNPSGAPTIASGAPNTLSGATAAVETVVPRSGPRR